MKVLNYPYFVRELKGKCLEVVMSRKPIIYYRRCHVCGAVTEQRDTIEQCGDCGKSIVPFLYYEDPAVGALSEDLPKPKYKLGEIRPILGLTAYW